MVIKYLLKSILILNFICMAWQGYRYQSEAIKFNEKHNFPTTGMELAESGWHLFWVVLLIPSFSVFLLADYWYP